MTSRNTDHYTTKDGCFDEWSNEYTKNIQNFANPSRQVYHFPHDRRWLKAHSQTIVCISGFPVFMPPVQLMQSSEGVVGVG
jgi:hypothetical protein